MPIVVAAIDPVTRIEGHLKVDIEVDTVGGVQQVTGVKTCGTLFRGFEKVLEGRDPRDAAIITSRICGVCPTSHAQAAVLALEAAAGTTIPGPARILRNLVHGACYLESHILHFYLLSLPDFIQGLGMPPWTPGFEMDRRVDKATSDLFTAHYLEAITMRRRCHEIGALFGGKLPHTPSYIAGGFTAVPSQPNIDTFSAGMDEILNFITTRYLPDVERLSSLYSDYFFIGRGYGNLLSYGVFELDDTATPAKLFSAGRIVNGAGSAQTVDTSAIAEDVTHSWYENADSGLHPSVGDSRAEYPKTGAYSWLKAPRYNDAPYECGPLSRMWVNGEYTNGVSTMDRIRARSYEAHKIAVAMKGWINELLAGDSTYNEDWVVPQNASGAGLTEAPRGALGHWLQIADGKIAKYQVITPTCWTISPRDDANQLGPLEQALLGTPVANVHHPVEALRVIHSVDPCLDCATHVLLAKGTRPNGLAS